MLIKAELCEEVLQLRMGKMSRARWPGSKVQVITDALHPSFRASISLTFDAGDTVRGERRNSNAVTLWYAIELVVMLEGLMAYHWLHEDKRGGRARSFRGFHLRRANHVKYSFASARGAARLFDNRECLVNLHLNFPARIPSPAKH